MKKVQLCVLLLLMAGWLPAQSPTVTNVTSSAPDGSYGIGSVIPIQVTFSSPVTVNTGTPTITLETGTTDRVISYVSGSGTNTLTFNYTVQIGDQSADLDYVANSLIAIALHKGSISDGVGTAELSGPETVVVSGNYAYVASNGGNALEIVNISNPSAPAHAGKLTLPGAWGVSVLGSYAYVTSYSGNSLNIVNVANPATPTLAGSLANGTGGALLSNPIGVFASGNYAYVASLGSNALEIVNISNPAAPVHAGSITDGTGGATLGGARAVFVSGNYAYVASQNDDALEIVNISNPAAPVHVGSIVHGSGGAILNGAYGVFVSGNYAYVASNLGNALEIVNISNPANPTHAGSVAITAAQSVYVNGNTAYVASNDPADAMVIVDVSNPNAPFIKSTVVNGQNGALLDNASSLTYTNGYVYVASWASNALEIIDVNPIRNAGNDGAILTLPSPGASGSLGFNKAISINAPPTITTFTPTSGPVGTSVTITGTNFNSTPANNIVYFGATRAVVTGGSATSLTVTVPSGATYQSITVTTNGLIAYSSKPFLVTFNGADVIDGSSFGGIYDFASGTDPRQVVVADFDNDGKIDLAGSNYSSNSVSFFRNTSSGAGDVNYAPKVDFNTGVGPSGMSTADFDGDGKLDLVASNFNAESVSVLRNTGTSGTISFAAKQDYPVPAFVSPFTVATGDFDNDGKADIAVVNLGNNTISVFRNTSSGPGSISFDTKIDIAIGASPNTVVTGDIDKDGKTDIVVASTNTSYVSVLRNTSSGSGNVSFAAGQNFTAIFNPQNLALGDLDGDDKLDLVVVNPESNSVSVLRNTSSAGTISFSAKNDFPSGQNPLYVAIGDLNGDGKPDLAVDNFDFATISILKNISTGAGNIGFSPKVDFGIGSQSYVVALGDCNGDGKSDLIVNAPTGNTVSVMLNTIATTLPFITTWVTTDGTITIPTTGSGYNYSVTWTNLTNPGVGDGFVAGQTGNYTIIGLQNGSTYRIEISGDFPRIYFNNAGDKDKILTIEQWGNISWTSMIGAFYGCTNLTYNAADAPDLSGVSSMAHMFRGASSFSGDLSSWNTANVTDMSNMFRDAISFNGNISTWNTSSVSDMNFMFGGASSFNQNIGSWNTINVGNMSNMFVNATAFNSNISSWNTGNVFDMSFMFFLATSFNQDISGWNVSNVTNMFGMFSEAYSFNQPLENWDVSMVTIMNNMFSLATSFNQPINNWNVGNVTSMAGMFIRANSFNQSLSNWDVSKVQDMSYLFSNAAAFNQDLGTWDIGSVTDMSFMLDNTALSIANYDATLIGWATLGAGETKIPTNIVLDAAGLTYCSGTTARQALIDTYGWTITGDTENCGPTVTNVGSSATDGPYGVGAVIPVTVTFSTAVTVTGTPTLTLETGTTDRVVNYTSGTGTSTLTFNYTVQAGDVSADLDYLNTTALALNGGTIKDAGNLDAILTLAAPAAAGSLGANKAIVIDGVDPLAPSAPDLATADDTGASSTDNITSIDAGLTLTGTAESGALVTFTEAGLGVLGSVTATGGNYSFDFDIGSGTYNITATAQDLAGNTSVASGSLSITIDTGNPTVTVNQSVSQADPASSVPVTFDVVFNKAINPATFNDTDITLGGTALGQSVTSLTNPSSDNINWVITITATSSGRITPSIAAALLEDVAGNTNTASISTDNSVDYISCVNPVLALSSTANTFCVGGNGSATVDTIDGIPNPSGYTYQWYTGTDTSSPIPSATNSTVNGLIGGEYTVKVTQTISGCSSTSTITVPDLGGPYTLLTTYTVNQPTCTIVTASVDFTDLPTSSWTITASPLGTILNGTTATATFSGLPAGSTYTFFLRDNVSGCTIAETSPEVIDPAPVSPALTPSTTPNTACDANYNGGINITAITSSGEPGGYSYLISSGPIGTYPTSGALTGSTLTLSDLPPGNYSIDITNNDNTCSSNAALSVIDNILLPDIVLGTSPSVIQGTTVASLPYTSTTGTPDQYAIDFDATAEAQGFADVAYTTLPVSPVSITVPAAAIAATYNATLTVKNSTTACVSVNKLFTVQVTRAAPVIAAVTIPNVSMKIGDIVTTTITVNSSTETFTLPGGSTIGGFALGGLVKVNNTTYTATFTIVSGGTDVAAGNNIPVNVILNGTGGNSAAFTTAIAQASDPIDANAPLFSATAPATNSTISNTQVSYTLSENLASGSITWTRTGGTADAGSPHVQALSGTELTAGTKTNITLNNNPSLVIGAVYSISFSGADVAGNTAAVVTNTNITFNTDVTAPTVFNINYQSPATSPTNATGLTFRVIFSETVTGVAAADFTPATAGVTIGALTVVAVNGTTYDVSIASVTGSGTVRLDVLNNATITDAAGNPYVANFTTGQVYAIDQTAPVFSATAPLSNSTVTNANVSYTVSEALASGTITWTRTGGTADAGSPHVQTLSGSELAAGAKTNITLTNNPTLINGAVYSVAFGGTDVVGNPASIVTNTNITFNNDATPPFVTSINYQTPAASPTNATTVTFRVTFNEPVLNVDANDFTKTLTGVAGGAITVTAINGSTYDASFAVAGSGTVRLDVLSSASITDALGNVYASNFTSGAVYAIDQTPPLFSGTAPASNSTIGAAQVSYTLSEDLSSGTITWTRTGGAADAGSPHIQILSGSELVAGPHPGITLSDNPDLIAGASYTVTFAGVDLVGNSSLPVTETNVTFLPPAGNLSDIIASSNFSYPQNISYASYQESNSLQNSSTSIVAARFAVRDGGATGDPDPFSTIISSMTIDLGNNFSMIRRIALFDESGNELEGTDKSVSSQKISFSGLSIESKDNSSTSFYIRVSFTEKVTDNAQISFSISAVTAQNGGSGFADSNGGGASSPTSGNINRIEVIATKLNFVQQPGNVFINEVMSPSVTLEAIDDLNNRDLDFSGEIGFTSQTSINSNPAVAMSSGFGSSSDIIFNSAGSGFTLTTTNSAGLTNTTSDPFDVFEDAETISLTIKSFITPNSADNENNVLYIENIEFFPDNIVKLIDRWGVPIKSWNNFNNYTTPEPEQADFNFANLDIGNYICIVEYVNPTNGTKKSQTQMITVLK